jgi:hypothetical protein
MLMMVPIQVGECTLFRKAKFRCDLEDESVFCISATHASALLKTRGINLSTCDIYNWSNEDRGHVRLRKRFPEGVTITKLVQDTRRRRRLEHRIQQGNAQSARDS